MVYGNVNQNPGITFMDGVYQLDKLFQGGNPGIEFRQSGSMAVKLSAA